MSCSVSCQTILKWWLTVLFSRLDCVYGVQSNMCYASFFCIIFLIIYLYSTQLCPFSFECSIDFLVLWSPSLRNTPVCCDLLNPLSCASKRHAPQLSGSRSGCIVNNGIVNNTWIWARLRPREEERAERAEPCKHTALNGMFLLVVVSYF